MQKEFEGKDKQIGVLITNLGTPDSPTKKGLKKYLNQFLYCFYFFAEQKQKILKIQPQFLCITNLEYQNTLQQV